MRQELKLRAQQAERGNHSDLLWGSVGQVELHALVIGRDTLGLRGLCGAR